MSQELIDGLLSLSIRVSDMEKEIGMPLNTLSSVLKGTRPFPPKWVVKTKEYIARTSQPVIEKFTMEEVEKKLHDPSFLSTFLLKHPDPEFVRTACLHYLGDDYQELDHFVRMSGASIPTILTGYSAWKVRLPEEVRYGPQEGIKTAALSVVPDPKVNSYDAYAFEIKGTTYSGDLQKIMKTVEADTELGAVKRAKLRAVADEHRTTFTN